MAGLRNVDEGFVVRLSLLASPFTLGRNGLDVVYVIQLLSTNDRYSDDANCGQLSDTISSEKPKRANASFI